MATSDTKVTEVAESSPLSNRDDHSRSEVDTNDEKEPESSEKTELNDAENNNEEIKEYAHKC